LIGYNLNPPVEQNLLQGYGVAVASN